MTGNLVIGSRRSRLARVQAEWVGGCLERACPGLRVEFRTMSTAGDRTADIPLPEIGGKGLFTEDLERALQDGEIDLAVHSLKDLPTAEPKGAMLVATPTREDARDVLVPGPGISTGPGPLAGIPAGSTVGTSSVRRVAQLRHHAPHLRAGNIRGNVETRLKRLEAGDFDAVILAAAGLRRLGLWPVGTAVLEPGEWLPAPGQGALGVHGRRGDPRVASLISAIDDPDTRAAVTAERTLLAGLEGGCSAPIAAFATLEQGGLVLRAAVYSLAGARGPIEGTETGLALEAQAIGERLATRMLDAGAARVIDEARGALTREETIRRFGPTRDAKLVFTNGCFDGLHDGHRSLIQRAKALGDLLVVGLNSDASVRRLKGPDRPAQPLATRARALAGLPAVDAVVPFDEDTPLTLIEALHPDVLVKGADYDRASVVGGDFVEAGGGRVVLLDLLPEGSGDESP